LGFEKMHYVFLFESHSTRKTRITNQDQITRKIN
jgi:hypothetical protein